MTARTATFTDFLAARLDEDEAVAQEAALDGYSIDSGLRYGEVADDGMSDLIVDPTRILAEVSAKRQILRLAVASRPVMDYDASWAFDEVLRNLTAAYADHPDYDESWRP